MKPSAMMQIEHNPAQMWRLSDDRRTLRMALPGLVIDGLPEPIQVKMHFDAGTADQMIERLMVLRAQMLPRPPPAAKRN